jgi:hypothetical protein
MTSGHPRDEAEGYCGKCHDWTGTDVDRAARRLRIELGWRLGWVDYKRIAQAVLDDARRDSP